MAGRCGVLKVASGFDLLVILPDGSLALAACCLYCTLLMQAALHCDVGGINRRGSCTPRQADSELAVDSWNLWIHSAAHAFSTCLQRQRRACNRTCVWFCCQLLTRRALVTRWRGDLVFPLKFLDAVC